jgi:hypothetical protein
MTNVILFPDVRKLPHVVDTERETVREARLKLQECWAIRAESRAIQRRYQERQRRIDALMDGLGI